jgi:hypothetical protein
MALSAHDRIFLLRVKIERAKHHLRELETELLASKGQSKYVGLTDEDPDSGERTQYHRLLPIYTFNTLACAGDIVHALRSALDHLVYQLSIAGCDQVPSRQVEFPIAKDRDTYEAEKTRKVRGIRPEAIEEIDRLKPFKDGNDVLWRIHELDNIDKHRFIFTVGDDALFTAPWIEAFGEFLLRPAALKSDSPLFSGAFADEAESSVNFEIGEAVSGSQIGETNALLPSLRQWVDYIESVILSFEPHLWTR